MDNQAPVYRYTPKGLYPVMDTQDRLLVADSFLVDNGMARAPHLHETRFSKSCRTLAKINAENLAHFWQLAMQQIPAQGQWFPRLELVFSRNRPALQIRLRPAPDRHSEVRLIHCGTPDRRKQPRHKGPDILMLTEQRKKAIDMGAEEGVLCTPSHYLLEGLFSSILWWEENTLCQTPPSRRVLPSVTATLLKEVAAIRGVRFAFRSRHCHELNGCETWAVNALHGIRRALNWPLSPWQTPPHTNRDDWQQALNDYAMRPVHPGSSV